MTCRVINLLAASPVSTPSLYFHHIGFIPFIHLNNHPVDIYIYFWLTWNSNASLSGKKKKTFPKILTFLLRLLLFFHVKKQKYLSTTFFSCLHRSDNWHHSCCSMHRFTFTRFYLAVSQFLHLAVLMCVWVIGVASRQAIVEHVCSLAHTWHALNVMYVAGVCARMHVAHENPFLPWHDKNGEKNNMCMT
jgi:hypothetical protein